jgi:hypothetical protein
VVIVHLDPGPDVIHHGSAQAFHIPGALPCHTGLCRPHYATGDNQASPCSLGTKSPVLYDPDPKPTMHRASFAPVEPCPAKTEHHHDFELTYDVMVSF